MLYRSSFCPLLVSGVLAKRNAHSLAWDLTEHACVTFVLERIQRLCDGDGVLPTAIVFGRSLRAHFSSPQTSKSGKRCFQPCTALLSAQRALHALLLPQVLLLSQRQYQTGLQEVEPWPHAKSAIEEVPSIKDLIKTKSLLACMQYRVHACLRTQAETPPSSWYTSPSVLQAELATVFQKPWLVGFSDLPQFTSAALNNATTASYTCTAADG